jgi:hypothetical protein
MNGSESRTRRRSPLRVRQGGAIAATCAFIFTMTRPATAAPDLAVTAAAAAAAGAAAAPAPYVDSTAIIANPERGLYDHDGNCDVQPFDEVRLKNLRRDQNITLARCSFYLKGYQAKALDPAVLAKLKDRFDTARRLGFKLVLRFAYTEADDIDASAAMVDKHIDQLTPLLQANSSIIDVLESGFVGRWGEGYYTHQIVNGTTTDDYGDQGHVTTEQWARRKHIVDKLLVVLPSGRSTQVRTVLMKSHMYGPTVKPFGPPAVLAAARVGIHNDCVFGDHNDAGTYSRGTIDRSFLAADSKYVPVGGEICGDREPAEGQQMPASDKIVHCLVATTEFETFHFTHLGNGQGEWTRANWATEGCMPEIAKRLGYRLSLAGTSFPTSVPRGQTFLAQVFIHNSGWAAPIANRPVQLVLRKAGTTGTAVAFTGATPKTWYPGTTTLVAGQFGIPTFMTPGTYEVLLRLPDSDPALRARLCDPATDPLCVPYPYDIQLATQGAWEKATGLNKLARDIQIT